MRPEGWKNLHNDIDSSRMLRVGTLREYTSDFKIFEAGADALLEGLKKKGVRITKATRMVTQPIFEEGDGYLVFIPEEKR